MLIKGAKWRMADRLADGQLASILLHLRGEKRSFDEIARLLYAEHGIEVTRQTLSDWHARVEAESQPEQAAS